MKSWTPTPDQAADLIAWTDSKSGPSVVAGAYFEMVVDARKRREQIDLSDLSDRLMDEARTSHGRRNLSEANA